MYMKFAEALPVARITLLRLGFAPSPALVWSLRSSVSVLVPPHPLERNSSLRVVGLRLRRCHHISGTMPFTRLLSICCCSQREMVRSPQRLSSVSRSSRSCYLHSTKGCWHSRTPESKVSLFPPRLGQNRWYRFDSGPSRFVVERILDDLIDLHKSHSSFRHLFKSQSSTEILIACVLSSLRDDDPKVSAQLTRLGSLVATRNNVSPAQKQQVIDNEIFGSRQV